MGYIQVMMHGSNQLRSFLSCLFRPGSRECSFKQNVKDSCVFLQLWHESLEHLF